jgi:putative transcriptional regulator
MKNKVRQERIEKNMTQTDLADSLGVSRQTIFAIETAKYVPSTILALRLAKIFNKPVEDFFELEKKDFL